MRTIPQEEIHIRYEIAESETTIRIGDEITKEKISRNDLNRMKKRVAKNKIVQAEKKEEKGGGKNQNSATMRPCTHLKQYFISVV